MKGIKKRLKREDFTRVYNIYPNQSWLCDKEDSLVELIELCDTTEHKDLVIDLLSEFRYLDQKVYSEYLSFICDCIINDSGFEKSKTIVASITIDDESDSSQSVLYDLRLPLQKNGWGDVKTVNRFNDIPKNFKKGKNQIILIDEFIGSGKTILGRIKNIGEWLNGEFELKFCFIVGMDFGIKVIEEMGFEVFCPLRLPKGISERYSGESEYLAIEKMKQIESKLAQEINNHQLETYTLGYNNTQALYSMEACLGNTPNSVFPIFWWPRYYNNQTRITLLTRAETGF